MNGSYVDQEIGLKDDPSLLDLMVRDSRTASEFYRPGKYWSSMTRAARREIKQFGLSDFRGSTNSIATSYGDNAFVDVRGNYHFAARALLTWLFRSVFPFKTVFDDQVQLTTGYLANANRFRGYYLRGNRRAQELLEAYTVPKDNCRGGCQAFTEMDGLRMSHLYWQLLDTIDQVHQAVGLDRRRSFFEIGGGFGVNVHLLIENFPNIRKIVYLDIPPNLYVGTQYLRSFFGHHVRSYAETRSLERISFEDNDDLEIQCIMPHQIERIAAGVDLFHNAHSFVEMPSQVVANYARHVSRIVSEPEGAISLVTYMSDGEGKTISSEALPGFFPRQFARREVRTLDPKWTHVHFTSMKT